MLPEHTGTATSPPPDDAVAQMLAELVGQQERSAQQHTAQQHTGQTQLLPMLHAITHRFGCIEDAHVRALAHALNLSRAEVFGVLTFYDDFTQVARPTPTFEVCAAEACQARGANALLQATQGRADVRAVYCLGNCACGPSVRVGDRVYARVTVQALSALIAQTPAAQREAAVRADTVVAPGPVVGPGPVVEQGPVLQQGIAPS